MTPSRWSTVLRRVTTEGPYINERMSVLVLTVVVVAGMSAVAYAGQIRGFGFARSFVFPAISSERSSPSASHQSCAFGGLSGSA